MAMAQSEAKRLIEAAEFATETMARLLTGYYNKDSRGELKLWASRINEIADVLKTSAKAINEAAEAF